MVRFEDLLYRLEEVVNAIRDCIGMEKAKPFKNLISRSKGHGNPTDFVLSLTKHVSTVGRHRGLNADDRQYAHEVLSPRLMETFGYEQCPLEVDPADLAGPFLGWRINDRSHRGRPERRVDPRLRHRLHAAVRRSEEREALLQRLQDSHAQRVFNLHLTPENTRDQRST